MPAVARAAAGQTTRGASRPYLHVSLAEAGVA